MAAWSGCVQTIFAEMRWLAHTEEIGVRAQFRTRIIARRVGYFPELGSDPNFLYPNFRLRYVLHSTPRS